MDDLARRASISRPGLYLYFSSKQALLLAAVEHALARDVALAEGVLVDTHARLQARLLEAFDLWAGQYVGPLAADLDGLLEADASLLGDLPERYSTRFRTAVLRALQADEAARTPAPAPAPADADEVCEVLLALVSGIKHRATDRNDFRDRLGRGLRLLLR